MANVEELHESREGGGRGLIGSLGRTRSFVVTLDAAEDDPIQTLQDFATGVRLGDLYPYDGDQINGIVAVFFSPRRHLTTLTWEVEVAYDVPIFFPNANTPWTFRLRGGQETEEIEVDLDGKPIGTPRYPVLDSANPNWFFRASYGYDDTTGIPKTVYFGNPTDANGIRYVEPAQRTRDVGEMFLEKTVGTLSTALARLIMDYNNSVNSDWVTVVTSLSPHYATRIAAPGLLKFAPPEILEIPGTDPTLGQTTPGISYQLSFALQFNPEGWKHKVTHRYTDQATGNRGIIRDRDGRAKTEEFKLYKTRDFTSLLSRF